MIKLNTTPVGAGLEQTRLPYSTAYKAVTHPVGVSRPALAMSGQSMGAAWAETLKAQALVQPRFGMFSSEFDFERNSYDSAAELVGEYERAPRLDDLKEELTVLAHTTDGRMYLEKLLLDAVSVPNFLLLDTMMKTGVDVNAVWSYKNKRINAVERAIDADNPDGLMLLVRYGARLEREFDEDGGLYSAYLHALSKNNGSMAKLAEAMGAEVDRADETGKNALFYWSTLNDREEMLRLLDRGLNVSGVESYGGRTLVSTLLPWMLPSDPLVDRVLNEMGRDYVVESNVRSLWEDLLTDNAFEPPANQRENWVKRLLRSGLRVDDNLGADGTPFLLAACNGHRDVTTLLQAAGSDLSAKNLAGQNAFWLSVKGGNLFMMDDLRRARVPVNVKDGVNQSALHVAASTNYESAFKQLSEADRQALGVENMSQLTAKIFDFLFGLKALDINDQDSKGMTPLMLAVKANNIEAVHFLLQRNPRLDLKNSNGRTALDLAQTVMSNFVNLDDPTTGMIYTKIRNHQIQRT